MSQTITRDIPIAIVARSHPPATKWAGRVLQPSSLMLPAPPLPAPSLMATSPAGVETWFLGSLTLTLHPGDAANMRQNLRMNPARLWVALAHADVAERCRVHAITADPFEGEAMATDTELTVAALPMPANLAAHIEAFCALFPEEERFRKKKRIGIEAEDPGLLAPRILPGGYRPGPQNRPRREGEG